MARSARSHLLRNRPAAFHLPPPPSTSLPHPPLPPTASTLASRPRRCRGVGTLPLPRCVMGGVLAGECVRAVVWGCGGLLTGVCVCVCGRSAHQWHMMAPTRALHPALHPEHHTATPPPHHSRHRRRNPPLDLSRPLRSSSVTSACQLDSRVAAVVTHRSVTPRRNQLPHNSDPISTT